MRPGTLRAAIAKYAALDLHFLNYGGSGHVHMHFLSFFEKRQRVMAEEGHRAGMTVQVHVTPPGSIDMAIEAGVEILTHRDIPRPRYPVPAETIRKMLERGTAVSVRAVTQRQTEAHKRHSPSGVRTSYMQIASVNIRNMVKVGARQMVCANAGCSTRCCSPSRRCSPSIARRWTATPSRWRR